MHFLAFRFKRAHLRTLALTRPKAAEFELTPARFDLLYAVSKYAFTLCPQAEIRRILGVARATVSRMLKSLEDLGFIVRTPSPFDKRCKDVTLTDIGLMRVRECYGEVNLGDYVQEKYENAFELSADDRFIRVDELHTAVSRVARWIGDTATLEYPTFHPDD